MSSSGKERFFYLPARLPLLLDTTYQKPRCVIDRLISEYFPELLEGVPTVPQQSRIH